MQSDEELMPPPAPRHKRKRAARPALVDKMTINDKVSREVQYITKNILANPCAMYTDVNRIKLDHIDHVYCPDCEKIYCGHCRTQVNGVGIGMYVEGWKELKNCRVTCAHFRRTEKNRKLKEINVRLQNCTFLTHLLPALHEHLKPLLLEDEKSFSCRS